MEVSAKNTLLNGFRLNMDYTLELVKDVREEDMCAQPRGFINHPTFTIGHLVTATALTGKVMGEPYDVPEGWDELFRRKGPGAPQLPETDARKYPGKHELMTVLNEKYIMVHELIGRLSPDRWSERYVWKLDRYMPTVGEVLHFQCLVHHSWHIGQLAEWRRMMGYPSALRRLM